MLRECWACASRNQQAHKQEMWYLNAQNKKQKHKLGFWIWKMCTPPWVLLPGFLSWDWQKWMSGCCVLSGASATHKFSHSLLCVHWMHSMESYRWTVNEAHIGKRLLLYKVQDLTGVCSVLELWRLPVSLSEQWQEACPWDITQSQADGGRVVPQPWLCYLQYLNILSLCFPAGVIWTSGKRKYK